jgi:nucleoid-associated protein YgaU
MFLSDGKPVRAKLEVTFKSLFDIKSAQRKSPFESPDRTKYRTIHEGEQLWNFANREYGSPEMWRVIAKENGIMNPLDIYPGQVIKLPAL